MNQITNMDDISNIIVALSRHSDDSAVQVLENVGTNSDDELVRQLTAKALITRNTHDSLKVVLIYKGKGIHDMNASVAESAISSLRALSDKSEACKILDDTINLHSDDDVRSKAREVKDMIAGSMN